ncbi:MAG: hypothetical protein KC931_19930 [Candidatus Omnitrophica bacterium]|nr:hypothetical protein [Candidatus Omnitrophota bacterium]
MRRRRPRREEEVLTIAPSRAETPTVSDATTDQIRMLLDRCMEIVGRDPEVALKGPQIDWDSWFSQPVLSAARRCNFPTTLKQRLLAFLALMLPFLDEREQERVQMTLTNLSPREADCGEILTEQDLIHAQWLVKAIRRSNDIQSQMEGLQRSISRSIQTCRVF